MTKMWFAVTLFFFNVYLMLTTTSTFGRIFDGLVALFILIGIYGLVRIAWDKRKEIHETP